MCLLAKAVIQRGWEGNGYFLVGLFFHNSVNLPSVREDLMKRV